MAVHPLIFEPIYKRRIWGGQEIFRYFGRPSTSAEPIGESWELVDLPGEQSVVRSGSAKGQTLHEVMQAWGDNLLGSAHPMGGRFPLLIKFLDARQDLSVQVHPSEAAAREINGDVKHEAWHVLAAAPGAVIWHGLEPGVTAATFRKAMTTGQVEGVLRRVPVRAGDCVYLPSGTPHALGAGVLVAEVQTPSDTTYRAYDWGRVDPTTGRPRELHLEQAIRCIDFDAPSPPPTQERSHIASLWTAVTRLAACPYFVIERVRMIEGAEQQIPHAEPVVWIVLEGSGEVECSIGGGLAQFPFTRGDVVLLPAALQEGRVRITAPTQWLEVTVPVPSDLAEYEHPPREENAGDAPGEQVVQIRLPKDQ
jgi:mannose-6-phosphate isomerase